MKIVFVNSKVVFRGIKEIDPNDYIQSVTTEENSEFSKSIVDADGKLLWGLYADGGETNINLSGIMVGDTPLSVIVNAIKKM